MRLPISLRFVVLLGIFWASLATAADSDELRLPAIISHNMVLQQKVSCPIWGWAPEGEKVVVQFRGKTVSTISRDGQWRLRLRNLKPGGPDTLTVKSGARTIEITNVLVGEVWVGSGQSNMEWPLSKTFDSDNGIASATNASIRLFTVPKLKLEQPTNNVAARWVVCSPETVKNFSAVAYYFGRDLSEARKLPVGLIHTSWGGSPAEVWLSEDALATNPRYQREILEPYPEQLRKTQEQMKKWDDEAEELKKEGKKPARNRPGLGWQPASLYNGMIAPLIPYAIRGAIWYQGESNAGRAEQYRTLFPDMIQNWRTKWGQKWSHRNFPFLAVQLAPFMQKRDEPRDSAWAELREAQLLATKKLPKVGMVVITDVGDEKDIHPQKKEPVGSRLALAARGIAYKEKITWSGPIYKAMKLDDDRIILSFDHVGTGLEKRGDELEGFAIAGPDRKFVWADAKIIGNKVVVSSPDVKAPVAVRYGWADFPVVNLWNKDGLPATPFRTDNFPMITAPKRKTELTTP